MCYGRCFPCWRRSRCRVTWHCTSHTADTAPSTARRHFELGSSGWACCRSSPVGLRGGSRAHQGRQRRRTVVTGCRRGRRATTAGTRSAGDRRYGLGVARLSWRRWWRHVTMSVDVGECYWRRGGVWYSSCRVVYWWLHTKQNTTFTLICKIRVNAKNIFRYACLYLGNCLMRDNKILLADSFHPYPRYLADCHAKSLLCCVQHWIKIIDFR